LENHPKLVAALARGRELLGNPPEVLRRVRDWRILGPVLEGAGLPAPRVFFPGGEGRADRSRRWLSKPEAGAGSSGVRYWDGRPLPRGRYLQEFLPGVSGSFTFLADGRDALPVGITEQLLGLREFTERSFGWCGNLTPFEASPEASADMEEVLRRTGEVLAGAFGLLGLNGIDFVLSDRGGRLLPCPVEINPRPSASLEVLEARLGRSLFGDHLRACRGHLPREPLLPKGQKDGFSGKAIVYARRCRIAPATDSWYGLGRRDVPHEGDSLSRGMPICTVLGEGRSRSDCLEALRRGARAVRAEIGDRLDRAERRDEAWDSGSSS
jgi:predicted ATP-grasp superfamily ATP-dependent carboligase